MRENSPFFPNRKYDGDIDKIIVQFHIGSGQKFLSSLKDLQHFDTLTLGQIEVSETTSESGVVDRRS